MKHLALALPALLAAFVAGAAQAQSGADIGVLTCKLTDVDNIVVYTKETFACEFKPAKGKEESYVGQIKQVGIDLSIDKNFELVWAVLAPTEVAYEPGSLRGTYVGTGADVALGGGVGAKVLVGGGENSFSLQPVSVAGIVGAGASVGLQEFELK
ncbi:DUF992 domain-containing protein [Limibaculum sp. M0105]|uniref:DUF992 domain-containing protein n=1 Tax=Thermohalobaculum xanthum TaxID=2753746 RepID=A0A8J7SGH1_9RHOB|nr:DUF992 domain-containing protein [Thermohalobaculum xanthum]MBK0400891.1 DUF992 domain-containing protein [Thermohalobaculum xanthum]